MPGLFDASKSQSSFLESWFLYRSALSAADDANNPGAVTAVLDLSKSFKGTGNSIRIVPRRVSGSGTVSLILVRENNGSLSAVQAYTTIGTNAAVATLVESSFSDLIAGSYRVLITPSATSVWELHVATSVAGSSAEAETIVIPPQDLSLVWVPSTISLAELLVFSCSAANSLPGITALVFSQYNIQATGGFNFNHAKDLVEISFPNLVSVPSTGFLVCKNATLLTTVLLPNFLPGNGLTIDFSGCALTAASVNAILARCIANAAYVTGTVTLTGGTNAAPTGQGLTDKAALILRGVTVTTT
jgi:hypothetical protein